MRTGNPGLPDGVGLCVGSMILCILYVSVSFSYQTGLFFEWEEAYRVTIMDT